MTYLASQLPHYTMNNIASIESRFIKDYHIEKSHLIQIAAFQVANFIQLNYSSKTVHIICGKGTNGTDGLTTANLLALKKQAIYIYLTAPPNDLNPYSQKILHQCKKHNIPIYNCNQLNETTFSQNDIIVDSIVGIGLKQQLRPDFINLITQLNHINILKISLDVPTGTHDKMNPKTTSYFKPTITLCFGYLKTIFNIFPNQFGSIFLLDVGLPDFALPQKTGSKITYT